MSVPYTFGNAVQEAYELSGVLGTGKAFNPAQGQSAINSGQAWVDQQNSDDTFIYTIQPYIVTNLTGHTDFWGYYLNVGPTGDVVVNQRPAMLCDSSFRQLTTPPYNDIPLIPTLSMSDWNNIRGKGITSNIAFWGYYDQNWPTAKLYIWPEPTAGGGQLIVNLQQLLPTNFTLATTFNLPPAYRDAFIYNLAVRLAQKNGIEPPPGVNETAVNSLMMLKRNNGQILQRMDYDPSVLGGQGGVYSSTSDTFFGF